MQVQNEFQTQNDSNPYRAPKAGSKRRAWLIAALAVLIVVVAFLAGLAPRVRARAEVHRTTMILAQPTVSVITPEPSRSAQELMLPANVEPYISAPIYARASGYLKCWYADIGQHVRKGQLLAEIETPELEQQLQQARANLGTAQANLRLSKITAARYADLLKSNSVSQQDADNAQGKYDSDNANVQANEAAVRRLEQLHSFARVYAPFDGVITARNTDIGALITAGSGAAGVQLFQIAQNRKLRAYVSVPEAYAPAIKHGLAAELSFAAFPGQKFKGTLVRTAEAIDPTTRTLLSEIDVDNTNGKLLSGSYAQVHLNVGTSAKTFVIPANALLFRSEGLRVAVVNDGKVNLAPVTLGRDFGNKVEVIAGLSGGEKLIVNPPDSLINGDPVHVVTTTGEAGQ